MKKLITLCLVQSMIQYCEGQNFVNASLELWGSPTICEINVPPDSWSNYSNGGLAPDEGNLLLCPSSIPPAASAGNTYARMMAGTPVQGEGMYQFVSGFTPGGSYTIMYDFCGTNLWGGNSDCVWHLFLDDVDVNQSAVFSSADTAWTTNYFPFTATQVTHKIGVRAYTPAFGNSGSAAIDNFNIFRGLTTGIEYSSSAVSASVFPNPFHYTATLQLKNPVEQAELFIYNPLGELLEKQDILSNRSMIHREGLANGIYFYQVISCNSPIGYGKFVVE